MQPERTPAAVSWLPACLSPIWVTCVRSFSPLFCYAVPVFVCLPLSPLFSSTFWVIVASPDPSFPPCIRPRTRSERGAICRADKMKRISFHSPLLSSRGCIALAGSLPTKNHTELWVGEREREKNADITISKLHIFLEGTRIAQEGDPHAQACP